MKIEELPGQTVWIEGGTPVLYDSASADPAPVPRYNIVTIARVTPARECMPPLAIWVSGGRERGVDARQVANNVLSLPPSGNTWITRTADSIVSAVSHRRK